MFDSYRKSTGTRHTMTVALLLVALSSVLQYCRVKPIWVRVRFAGALLQCVVRHPRSGQLEGVLAGDHPFSRGSHAGSK